ncbi:MAG: tetratricopeptide repeat protein [Aureliella sp.]
MHALILIAVALTTQLGQTQFEKTLDFLVTTEATAWPSTDEAAEFNEWIDSELQKATGDRHANLLATRGFYNWCNGKRESGAADLRAALKEAPAHPRVLLLHTATHKQLFFDPQLAKMEQVEPWASEIKALKYLRDIPSPKTAAAVLLNLQNESGEIFKLIRGYESFLAGDLAEAETTVRSYLQSHRSGPLLCPDMPQFILGKIGLIKGDFEGLEALLKEGLELSAHSEHCGQLLVVLYCRTGKAQAALDLAKAVSVAHPKSRSADWAMAEALMALKEWRKSLLYLKRLYALDRNGYKVVNDLAYALHRMRGFKEAAQVLREYCSEHPGEDCNERFIFQAAIYESYAPEYDDEYKKTLVPELQKGIESNCGYPHDPILAVGAIANAGNFKLAEEMLVVIDKNPPEDVYRELLDAVRSAVASHTTFSICN